MNDTKNILLAWVSSVSTFFAAFESKALMTVLTAVVLPILFFAVGKTIDVFVQFYFKKRDDQRQKHDR